MFRFDSFITINQLTGMCQISGNRIWHPSCPHTVRIPQFLAIRSTVSIRIQSANSCPVLKDNQTQRALTGSENREDNSPVPGCPSCSSRFPCFPPLPLTSGWDASSRPSAVFTPLNIELLTNTYI
jgi:hypothetical protein